MKIKPVIINESSPEDWLRFTFDDDTAKVCIENNYHESVEIHIEDFEKLKEYVDKITGLKL